MVDKLDLDHIDLNIRQFEIVNLTPYPVYQLEKGNLGEEDVDSARGKNLSTSD
jgi:hypothetical protein